MTGAQIIVLATPVFLALIGIELAIGRARGRDGYRLNDALSSIGLGVMSQITGVFTRAADARHLRLRATTASRSGSCRRRRPGPGSVGLVAYDFLYYWHHRAGHRVALFWAAHVVHHQSEDYNLSTALRQTSSGWLAGWIFYLPMALAGFPPLVFAVVALIDLLYQFWVHTEQVGRLGWFDRWFCSPSNHRVHHAVNDAYLDRNYGGVLIVWDRLFGTYVEEDRAVPCVYGTRAPLSSWNPLWANLQVYADLARDSWRARRWRDKLRVWLEAARLAAGRRRGALAEAAVRGRRLRALRIRPCRARGSRSRFALFVALLGATMLFLWHAHALGWPQRIGCGAAIAVGLWGVGRLSEGTRALTATGALPARSHAGPEPQARHERGPAAAIAAHGARGARQQPGVSRPDDPAQRGRCGRLALHRARSGKPARLCAARGRARRRALRARPGRVPRRAVARRFDPLGVGEDDRGDDVLRRPGGAVAGVPRRAPRVRAPPDAKADAHGASPDRAGEEPGVAGRLWPHGAAPDRALGRRSARSASCARS